MLRLSQIIDDCLPILVPEGTVTSADCPARNYSRNMARKTDTFFYLSQPGGHSTKTTVSVYTKNGVIRAEDEGSDLYASIDAVADKLERKLRKLKVRVARFPNPDTVVRNIYWQLLQLHTSQVHCSARLRPHAG